ncbi:MAG: DUF2877 domain-containing protein [Candidatus Riflebacteria bacterium]|nr:DUF2877 domain-containing protein [Candidatus Riflebacteria bacterium]
MPETREPPVFRLRNDAWLDAGTNWTADVTATFTHGFDAHPGGGLAFFTSREEAVHPLAVLVPAGVVAAVRPGDPVSFSGGGLTIGPCRLSPGPALTPPGRPPLNDWSLVRENVRTIRRCLPLLPAASPLLDSIRGDVPTLFAAPLARLREGLAAGSLDLQAFLGWFGAGEGLTPSWDDLVTGLLLADRWAGRHRLSFPDALLEDLGGRTTAVARWQLAMAREGKSSLRWEAFLAHLLTRPVSARDILAAGRFGHSSGAEILAGISLALTDAPGHQSPG